MLANTLCHIPRVSQKKELALWGLGIHNWGSYRAIAKDPRFLDECEHHFAHKDSEFFAKYLKADQHWRLFGDFQDSVAYVDIETTGLDKNYDRITTIALYDGLRVRTYVSGRNLPMFCADIKDFKLLVTFNGKCFDVLFIEQSLGAKMPKAHIDLRYVMKRLGFSGGLKEVERRIGIDRGDLRAVDGLFAVKLWHEYSMQKNAAALETLLAYNCADVINLERLMITAYNLNTKETPFGLERQLNMPTQLEIPFEVDLKLVNRYAR